MSKRVAQHADPVFPNLLHQNINAALAEVVWLRDNYLTGKRWKSVDNHHRRAIKYLEAAQAVAWDVRTILDEGENTPLVVGAVVRIVEGE